MSGLAVRQALILGLNLRNNDRSLVESSKEIRYRVWWAIASTERTLCVMTGRPTSFVGDDCSAPLPLPLEEESFMAAKEPYETGAVRMLRRLSTDEGQSEMSASTPSSSVSSMATPFSPVQRYGGTNIHRRRMRLGPSAHAMGYSSSTVPNSTALTTRS